MASQEQGSGHFESRDLNLGEEMAQHVKYDTPYVVVTLQGKEFNMVVKGASSHCLFGHVAMNRHFVLYAYGNRPDMQPAIVDKPENVADDKTRLAVYEEPCVVESTQDLIFNANAIAILERPWRRFIPLDVYDASSRGPLDAKKVITVFPELARYYKDGIGFVKPQLPQSKFQPQPPPPPPQPGQPPTLRMVDNSDRNMSKSQPVVLEGEVVSEVVGKDPASSESED
jgi:hypothetical protein